MPPGRLVFLLFLIAFPPGPWAEEYEPLNYFGISLLQLHGSRAGGPDYHPNGILARLGFMGGKHFGLELQAGLSQTGDAFELRNVAGAYLHAGFPHERLQLFTLAGMARTTVKNTGRTETSENFSYGLGIRWRATDSTDIGAEWMNYAERTAYRVDTLNIGFVLHF